MAKKTKQTGGLKITSTGFSDSSGNYDTAGNKITQSSGNSSSSQSVSSTPETYTSNGQTYERPSRYTSGSQTMGFMDGSSYNADGSQVTPPRYTQPVEQPVNPNLAAGAMPMGKPTLGVVDEKKIREETRRSMQASIDAINANYSNLISQEKIIGDDRSGQTRALNARSGTIGSDFGQAAQNRQTAYNQQQQQYLRDQQNAQVASVVDKIEERASQRIQAAKSDALTQYQIDLNDFNTAKEEARADFQLLANSGIDLNTLQPAQKAALFKQAGYDEAMGEVIYNAMKPKPQQIDYQTVNVGGGRVLFYGVDPVTGELKQQIVDAGVPDDWSMTIAPDGTPIAFNKATGKTSLLGGNFSAPYTLGEGEVRFDAYGNVIAQGVQSSANQKIVKINGTDYVQNADGSFSLPNIPQAQASPQAQAQSKETIDQITGLLNSSGLNSAVGSNYLGRFSVWNQLSGEKQNAIGDIEQIVSQLTTDNLIKAKAEGATFGALSDGERDMLASAATKIGTWRIKDKDGNVTGYNVNEKSFRAELDKIARFAKQDYILKGGKPEDVGAQVMSNGAVAVKNSDGTYTEIIDQLPQQTTQVYGPPSPLTQAGNASASNQVKAYKQTLQKLDYIDPTTIPTLTGNSAGLAQSAMAKAPPGSTGGQCGTFVRQLTGKYGLTYPPLGDSLSSKMAAVMKYGTSSNNAKLGSVIVTKENPTYGHVAWIIGKNAQGFIVAESNFKQSEKVSYGRVIPFNSPKIVGVINPTKA